MAKRDGAASIPLSRFGVLVAQLESIAASARQQPPDALLCFDLLSELVSAINEEPKEAIQQWQRKCEDALYNLLVLGAQRPVRRLASLAMAQIIAKGDSISIYSRASSLQGWLADSKRGDPLSCAGAAQCLGELYHFFGRRITSGLVDTASIVSKLMKFHEDFVRQDALLLLHKALEGSGGLGAIAAYSEAFRIITRVGIGDRSFIVRLAAARCLKAFSNVGGPGLGISDLEAAALHCVKTLEDPVPSVRDAFAEALGAFLALGMNPDSQINHKGKATSPAKKVQGGLQKYLILPFMRANGSRAKELRIGLTLSWVFFLQVLRIKYGLPLSELQEFALQALDMLHESPLVDAHALACVLYIIRVGVTDQMTESAQRSFLVVLGRQLESSDFSHLKGIAALRTLSYLLGVLGEVPTEFKEILDSTIVAALSHSSLNVRIEAALTLRGLAEVDPTCVGGLISYGVTTLYALRESAFLEKGSRLKFELDSLHGQATVLAALVSISPKLLLGYPARLPKSVLDLSKKMLSESSRNSMVARVEKEAGWLLLASLITSMPKEELEDQVFDILLLWTDSLGKKFDDPIQHSDDLTSEISILCAAVEALTAFIRSFISPTTITCTRSAVLLQPVLVYLSCALSYISSFPVKQLESIKPTLDLLTIKTLVAYRSLPDPMSYRRDNSKILQICTSPFRDPSGFEESSCLRLLLDKKDAFLGPWMPGRDWFEDELRAFQGGKDGMLPCVWETHMSAFPQPEPISKILVNQMLLCFGCIFAVQDNSGKIMLLKMIGQCLKSGKRQFWHAASTTNACVGLLSGLKAFLSLRQQNLGIEILSALQSIFQDIIAEGDICAAQRRAASEGLGLLARTGDDSFTARMTRSLLGEIIVVSDPCYIGSLALSLGCIHRSAGGMALSTLVPATVTTLSLLARSPNTVLQQWALHALLLTIEAAGLSYVSQVQATLSLLMEILMTEESGQVDLRQGIGRLVNAIVAVLGPELSPGSTFFSRCKSVVAETSSGQEIATLLECVRFTQQLVLFAPQAVSVRSHVQTLLPTLSSRQPTLRHLAVSTLYHLIEKDPVAVIEERIEENLFRMLDEETDIVIGDLARTTIGRLLNVSCPSCPSRWLAICRNLILATSSRTAGNTESGLSNGTSDGEIKLYYGEDDDNMIASSKSEKMRGSISYMTANLKKDKHLRYRTRIFAAECLSILPIAVGSNPAHFDLSLARKQPAYGNLVCGDWLVLHLHELISIAYQISTSQFEGMQPIGVKLMVTIMEKFERITDPELPGHFLVEQYQAQFVSAVRSSISLSASPLLLEAGLQLASKILTSSIMNGDRVALQRMFSMISRPLDEFKDLYYPSFAEWVACKIKVRLLAAHASIKCHVYRLLRDKKNLPDEYRQLLPLFSNCSTFLGNYWIAVLKEYCFICFGLQLKSSYKPFLDGIQSFLVSSKVHPCLDEAWQLILEAVSLDSVPNNFNPKKYSDSEAEKLKYALLSGHSMVGLQLTEFQFLWGLALLTLFQGHQSVICTWSTLLCCQEDTKSSQATIEGRQVVMSIELSLSVLQALSAKLFFEMEYLNLENCQELLQVLVHDYQMSDSWDCLAIQLFSQIVRYCADGYFENEDFIFTVAELCLKYLCRTFHKTSSSSLLQHRLSGNGLLFALFSACEKIVYHLYHKKLWKLIMAFVSAGFECIKRTSADAYLSKVVTFVKTVFPLVGKCLEDGDELKIDDAYAFMGAWARSVECLTQDCVNMMHTLDKDNTDFSKLLAKKIAFCLEKAISIARLAYETQLHDNKNHNKFFYSLCKCCIKCVKIPLSDNNVQVQAIGLHMLKGFIQKERIDGSSASSCSFILFFIGEIVGEVFILIQKKLMEITSPENLAVMEESLRFLFLFHALAQGNSNVQDSMRVLLEAILMVFFYSDEVHSKELSHIKNVAIVLVSHLVQIPSSAIEIKEVLLSMPIIRRQQLQDIIRASAVPVCNEVHVKLVDSLPAIKLPEKLEPPSQEDSHLAIGHPHDAVKAEDNDGGDEDDDWDTFQSFPVNSVAPDLQSEKSGTVHCLSNGSPVSDETSFSKINFDYQDVSPVTEATERFDALEMNVAKEDGLTHCIDVNQLLPHVDQDFTEEENATSYHIQDDIESAEHFDATMDPTSHPGNYVAGKAR